MNKSVLLTTAMTALLLTATPGSSYGQGTGSPLVDSVYGAGIGGGIGAAIDGKKGARKGAIAGGVLGLAGGMPTQ